MGVKHHEVKDGAIAKSLAKIIAGLDDEMTPEEKAEGLIGIAGLLAHKAKRYGTPDAQVRQILEVALEAVR